MQPLKLSTHSTEFHVGHFIKFKDVQDGFKTAYASISAVDGDTYTIIPFDETPRQIDAFEIKGLADFQIGDTVLYTSMNDIQTYKGVVVDAFDAIGAPMYKVHLYKFGREALALEWNLTLIGRG